MICELIDSSVGYIAILVGGAALLFLQAYKITELIEIGIIGFQQA